MAPCADLRGPLPCQPSPPPPCPPVQRREREALKAQADALSGTTAEKARLRAQLNEAQGRVAEMERNQRRLEVRGPQHEGAADRPWRAVWWRTRIQECQLCMCAPPTTHLHPPPPPGLAVRALQEELQRLLAQITEGGQSISLPTGGLACGCMAWPSRQASMPAGHPHGQARSLTHSSACRTASAAPPAPRCVAPPPPPRAALMQATTSWTWCSCCAPRRTGPRASWRRSSRRWSACSASATGPSRTWRTCASRCARQAAWAGGGGGRGASHGPSKGQLRG